MTGAADPGAVDPGAVDPGTPRECARPGDWGVWGIAAGVLHLALVVAVWAFGSLLADVDVVPPGHPLLMYPLALAASSLVVGGAVAFARRNGIRPDRADPARQLYSALAEAGAAWLVFGAVVGLVAAGSPELLGSVGAIGTAAGLGLQGFALAVPAAALPVVLGCRIVIARDDRRRRGGGPAPRRANSGPRRPA